MQIYYGWHTVLSLLQNKSELVDKICITANVDLPKSIIALIKDLDIAIDISDNKSLDKLTKNGVHQGIVAIGKSVGSYNLIEFLNAYPNARRILAFDKVHDPHNLGASYRSAAAFGVDGILLLKSNSAGLTSAVHKVAMGGTFMVPTIQVSNLRQALVTLKDRDWWSVGAALGSGSIDVKQHLDSKLVIVFGNENTGLSNIVQKECDFLHKINIEPRVDSLNMSVAVGIFLYIFCAAS